MAVIWALLFDTLLGDPRVKIHPVALIGSLIAWLERIFYRSAAGKKEQFLAGMVLSIIVLLAVYDIVYAVMLGISYIDNAYVSYAAEGFILFWTICPRSLAQAANEIRHYLLRHRLRIARAKVGWIVGRDTEKLSEGEVVRATVETVAENTIDGILSPLFFFALGGAPLAACYRAANTLDSMIGYKNDKYLYFGRFAARLDDVLNYIPARIGALLYILMAALLRYDWKGAWRIVRRDASKHPSPNGGYAEAAVAGALGIRLGGYNSYFGKVSFRAYMGDPRHELGPGHIRQAVHLMYAVALSAAALTAWYCWQVA